MYLGLNYPESNDQTYNTWKLLPETEYCLFGSGSVQMGANRALEPRRRGTEVPTVRGSIPHFRKVVLAGFKG